jgi:type IV pilus assembly protein PilA
LRREGFTLTELMIVIAIIAVIAAVAIPSLVSSRKSANETRAIGVLKAIGSSQEMYRVRFGTYASDPDDLQDAGYLKISFPAYTPLLYNATESHWALLVGPTNPGIDGDRYFYVDQSGVIRFSEGGSAGPFDPPID